MIAALGKYRRKHEDIYCYYSSDVWLVILAARNTDTRDQWPLDPADNADWKIAKAESVVVPTRQVATVLSSVAYN